MEELHYSHFESYRFQERSCSTVFTPYTGRFGLCNCGAHPQLHQHQMSPVDLVPQRSQWESLLSQQPDDMKMMRCRMLEHLTNELTFHVKDKAICHFRLAGLESREEDSSMTPSKTYGIIENAHAANALQAVKLPVLEGALTIIGC